MIPFNVPPYIGKEDKYIKQAIDSRKFAVTVSLQRSVM